MAQLNIPQLTSLKDAVEMYYAKPMLFNKDIAELFGCTMPTAIKLKKRVSKEMTANNVPFFNVYAVDTATAFKVWGLDIDDLEKRVMKIKKVRGK